MFSSEVQIHLKSNFSYCTVSHVEKWLRGRYVKDKGGQQCDAKVKCINAVNPGMVHGTYVRTVCSLRLTVT